MLSVDFLSRELVENHLILYRGYVENTNKLSREIAGFLVSEEVLLVEFSELKRRFGWEFNGMRLHELFFENVCNGGVRLEKDSKLTKIIFRQYGSLEKLKKEIIQTGLIRGIGWVVLCQDDLSGNMFVSWINEHDGGILAGCELLLVIDVFEHAFMPDGLKRPDYLDRLWSNIDWGVVSKRSK